ncbi:MAG: acyl-CoA thioesterase [Pseudomonadales bacterium]|nr:acyl-CoA thioesterase [Pseudomonadales bacterium]
MAKITIDLPKTFLFSTQIDVLIQHINRADHLANEHLVALLNESRSRLYKQLGNNTLVNFREFINADLAVVYKSEAHYGDTLKIDIAADDFNKYGCDLVYRVSQADTGQCVAVAKMAMLRCDPQTGKLSPVPEGFNKLFQPKPL